MPRKTYDSITRHKRNTAAGWDGDTILLRAEIGIEDSGDPAVPSRMKIGDGVTVWSDLPYAETEADLLPASGFEDVIEGLSDGGLKHLRVGESLTAGEIEVNDSTILRGKGVHQDATTGSSFALTANNANLFNISAPSRYIKFQDMALDLKDRTGAKGVYISGENPDSSFMIHFDTVVFRNGEISVEIEDTVGPAAWQCTGVSFLNSTFTAPTVTGFQANSINTRFWFLGCDFNPSLNELNADCMRLLGSGTTSINNCTFNGNNDISPKTVNPVVASTAIASNVIESTAHGLTSQDSCYVVTSGTLWTGIYANQRYYIRVVDANHFTLHRTPLDAAVNINIVALAGGSGNMTFNTQHLIIAGRPRAAIYANGAISGLTISNCESENIAYFLLAEGDGITGRIHLENNNVQGAIVIRRDCEITSVSNYNIPVGAYQDQIDKRVIVHSIGDKVTENHADLGGQTAPYPWALSNFQNPRSIFTTERSVPSFPRDNPDCILEFDPHQSYYWYFGGINGTVDANPTDYSLRGGTITQHGSAAFVINQIGGRGVVRGDSTDAEFRFTACDGFDAYHFIAVVKCTSGTGGFLLGTDTDPDLYPNGSGDIQVGFGGDTRRAAVTPPVDITAYHILEWWSAPNDYCLKINGIVVQTDTSNTVAFPATAKFLTNGTNFSTMDIACAWLFKGKQKEETLDKYYQRIKDLYGLEVVVEGGGVADSLPTSEYADVDALITALGSSDLPVSLDDTKTISAAKVFPANTKIVPAGGTFTKSGSGTIEFEGVGLTAGAAMGSDVIFSGFAAGDITWSGTVCPPDISTDILDNASLSDRIDILSTGMDGLGTTIHTSPGEFTDQVTLRSHDLHIRGRGYTSSVPDTVTSMFIANDFTTIYGDGIGSSEIEESPDNLEFVRASGVAGSPYNGFNENIVVRDITFKGNASTAVDSSRQAVFLGNCRNGWVKDCLFDHTHGYAAYAGGFSTAGYMADGVYLVDNICRGLQTQNMGTVGGRNVHISRNIFVISTPPTASAQAIIDVEPNTNTEGSDGLNIQDNLIDGRLAQVSYNGITVQKAYGRVMRNVKITGNHIVGMNNAPVTFLHTDVDTTSNEITCIAHGKQTGQRIVLVKDDNGSGGALPGGFTGTSYDGWIIFIDIDTVQIAASYADALAGTEVDITTQGSGSYLLQPYRFLANGLQLSAIDVATVDDNTIIGASQCGISAGILHKSFVTNNKIVGCGGGGVEAMRIAGCTETDFADNKLLASSLPISQSTEILETNTTLTVDTTAGSPDVNVDGSDYVPRLFKGATITINSVDYVIYAVNGLSIRLTTNAASTLSNVTATIKSSNVYSNNKAAGGIELAAGTSYIVSTYEDKKMITVADADYTATTADGTIVYTSTTADRTVTLADATICKGKIIKVVDGSGSAASNSIIIDAYSSQLINGQPSVSITSPFGRSELQSNGVGWVIIGGNASIEVNWALGASTTASHTSSGFPASAAVDGRRHTGGTWNPGGGWDSGTGGTPPTLEVDFGAEREIHSIFLFFLADSLNYSTDPTTSDTGSSYKQTNYTLESWNGSTWDNIVTVTANSNIRKEHTGLTLTTSKLRFSGEGTPDNTTNYGRVIEIEAWGTV